MNKHIPIEKFENGLNSVGIGLDGNRHSIYNISEQPLNVRNKGVKYTSYKKLFCKFWVAVGFTLPISLY